MPAHIFIATSLDGFIARPDGDIDWLTPPPDVIEIAQGEDYGYDAFMASVDAIVMGRHSFEKVLSFGAWPYSDKPVIVLSSQPLRIDPTLAATVSQLGGDPRVVCEELARRGINELYVDGGLTAQRFLSAGMVDRVIITRVPVLLGRGIPLFGMVPHDIRLTHVRTQAFESGMVQTEYRVQR
jgi:dihydrofolate reductase